MSQTTKHHLMLREWLPLVAVVVSAFVFNASEFMPVALLTDIAEGFAISAAQAGMVITVYAWMVMILSLPLMIIASRLDFRRLLLLVIAVFCAGQIASALAPAFACLMAARIVVASTHAIFWSIATPLAIRVVSALFSRFYGRLRARFLIAAVAGVVASLALLGPLGGLVPGVVLACTGMGLFGTAMNVALQSEVIRNSALDDQAVATSIYSGIFNLGIGGGSAIGAVVCTYAGVGFIGWAGAALAALGLAYGACVLAPRLVAVR